MGEFYDMRLYNTYYLCKQCEPAISNLKIATIQQNQAYAIEDWENYTQALFTLRHVTALTECIDDFYATIPVFVREKPKPEIGPETRRILGVKQNIITNKIQTIIALYEGLNSSENNNGIDVKIPSCESLEKYISCLKEIDFIFTQCPFLQHKEGQIKFNTVDVGSQWVTFLVVATTGTAVTSYILKNLAMLVDKAIQAKSHILNLKQQEEIIRSQDLQNSVLETNLEIFDSLRKHYLSEAVKEMESELDEEFIKDGEERGKAEKSIEKLCGLLGKGVEIYASIDTQKEIQVLFPAFEDKVELPDNIIKYIEDNK